MWLQVALLIAACVSPAVAIYPDEVNHIDFHHALLGAPVPDSTFFLKPPSASNASLLYTISEKSIIGAINPRDGAVKWRHDLSKSAADTGAAGILRGLDGNDAVVGAVGDYISSWGAQDGKLVWEEKLAQGVVADLELLGLEDAASTSSARDTLALIRGKGAGIVRRLDGDSGKVKWEFKDDSGDVPFQVSSSSTEIFYISLQSAMLKGYKIKVTSLDSLTGRQTRQHVLSSEADVTSAESVLYVGANTASPLIVWADKSHNSLKINVIGTKQVSTVAIDNPSGQDIQQITIHAPHKLNSLSHFLVHYRTEAGAWAEVYHVDLKSSTVTKAYQLPYLPGQSVVATSNIDANVYFTRVTDAEAIVVSSASHGILGRWNLQAATSDIAIHAVAEVVSKGASVALRSAILRQSGDWQLIRNGQIEWNRPEALIDAVAATWVDAEVQEDLVHELEAEGHESLYGAYIHRVKRHARDLQHLPDWLKELPQRIVSSILGDEVTNLDSFGVAKPVIVATAKGRLYALDTGKQGSVMWSVQVTETTEWNVKAIVTRPGEATIYPSDGSSVTVSVSTGDIISRSAPKSSKLQSVAIVEDQIVGIQEDGTPASFDANSAFLVTTSADGRVLGWNGNDQKTPVWEFVPPSGEKVLEATARPAHDPVASIGKVLGNRSVLYKYLNTNLALVVAVNAQERTASVYLLDGVSGRVLHAATHAGVDSTQPIASAMSENWFTYSFYGDMANESSVKGYQLVISELFESDIPNDRGPLGSAENYTSIPNAHVDSLPLPHVITQSYIISEPLSHMAVTQTRQGITLRQLLCTLPASDALIGIPLYYLDPRRPIDRDPTAAELEESLARYTPYLDFDGKWYLSHSRDVAGIKTILSRPTLLESTSLVFAFGGDIFGTRVTPSQAFDILGKSFSKLQLVLTVAALVAGVLFLAPMARKKQVNMLWKAT